MGEEGEMYYAADINCYFHSENDYKRYKGLIPHPAHLCRPYVPNIIEPEWRRLARERWENRKPVKPAHTVVLGLKGAERSKYISDRNWRVIWARRAGETYRSIADREHLSFQMARLIYERYVRRFYPHSYWGA